MISNCKNNKISCRIIEADHTLQERTSTDKKLSDFEKKEAFHWKRRPVKEVNYYNTLLFDGAKITINPIVDFEFQ